MDTTNSAMFNKLLSIGQILEHTKNRLDFLSSRNSEQIQSRNEDLLKIEIRHENLD